MSNPFRPGDTVRRIGGAPSTGLQPGGEYIVEKPSGSTGVFLQGLSTCFAAENFDLVRRKELLREDLKDGMYVETDAGCKLYILQSRVILAGLMVGGVEVLGMQWDIFTRYLSFINRNDVHKYGKPIKVCDRDGSLVADLTPTAKKVTLELTQDQIDSLKEQGIYNG